MALVQMNFYAHTLDMCTEINMILPDTSQSYGEDPVEEDDRPIPVLYLLHGLSDDQTIWCRRTSIERYAATYRIGIVMPCAGRSFYSNEKYGARYWDFISEELPAIVQKYFRVSNRREDTFAAGLSMGGYGAMKLALRCPERYAAAASLSGVMDIVSTLNEEKHYALKEKIYGSEDTLKLGFNDLYAAAQQTAKRIDRPKLFLGCGTEDSFYTQHVSYVQWLKKLGYSVTDTEANGLGHQWEYWDVALPQVLHWLKVVCGAQI